MSKAPFRQLKWFEVLFFIFVLLVGLAHWSDAFSALLFNPHSTIGAFLFLWLFVTGCISFLALFILVPWAFVEIVKRPEVRTFSKMIVALLGFLQLGVLTLWILRISV